MYVGNALNKRPNWIAYIINI